MAAAPANPDDFRMSFGDHLEELRGRIIKALYGVVLAGVLTYYYGDKLIGWITEPLNAAQISAGLPPILVTPTVTSAFFTYIKVTMISALILASPWVLYQVWKFIEAGLYSHERRVVYFLAPASATMTALGVVFMYYLMLPLTLAFLLFFAVNLGPTGGGLAATAPAETQTTVQAPAVDRVPQLDVDPIEPAPGQMWVNVRQNALKIQVAGRTLVAYLAAGSLVNPLIDVGQYIDFVMFMTLGIVIAFQMPVAMVVLGWVGVARSNVLGKYRKYMLFICFCLSAVLTPSGDPLSMCVLAVPLYILFELGLILMWATQREEENEDEEEDEDDDEDDEDDNEDEDEDEDDEDEDEDEDEK